MNYVQKQSLARHADYSPKCRQGGDRDIDAVEYVVYGRNRNTNEVVTVAVDAACEMDAMLAAGTGRPWFIASHAKSRTWTAAELEAETGISINVSESPLTNACAVCGVAVSQHSTYCLAHRPQGVAHRSNPQRHQAPVLIPRRFS